MIIKQAVQKHLQISVSYQRIQKVANVNVKNICQDVQVNFSSNEGYLTSQDFRLTYFMPLVSFCTP